MPCPAPRPAPCWRARLARRPWWHRPSWRAFAFDWMPAVAVCASGVTTASVRWFNTLRASNADGSVRCRKHVNESVAGSGHARSWKGTVDGTAQVSDDQPGGFIDDRLWTGRGSRLGHPPGGSRGRATIVRRCAFPRCACWQEGSSLSRSGAARAGDGDRDRGRVRGVGQSPGAEHIQLVLDQQQSARGQAGPDRAQRLFGA